jgi:pheromone shutdown protein TraB
VLPVVCLMSNECLESLHRTGLILSHHMNTQVLLLLKTGTKNVVGVIGKGHVRGVLYNLTKHDSSSLRFRDLVGSKNVKGRGPEQRQKLARRVAFELALAAVAYFAWEAFRTHV